MIVFEAYLFALISYMSYLQIVQWISLSILLNNQFHKQIPYKRGKYVV